MESRLLFLGSLLVGGCLFDQEVDLGPTGGAGGQTSSTGGVAPQSGGWGGAGTPGTGGEVTGGTAHGGMANGGAANGGIANGGTATGGVVTGGAPTGGSGGAAVPECEIVSSLPEIGTNCTQAQLGESWCLPNGDRCVCQHDTWYCNTRCATDYPTVPTPNAPCLTGAACNYPTGDSCTCIAGHWRCLGRIGASCPANVPSSGDPCQDSEFGNGCEYPSSVRGDSQQNIVICECGGLLGIFPPPLPGRPPAWTCYEQGVNSAPCPATQPPYDFDTKCAMEASRTLCLYGSTECLCMSFYDGAESNYYPWICGLATYPQSYVGM